MELLVEDYEKCGETLDRMGFNGGVLDLGCTRTVQKGGVCITHGAKNLKRCSQEGCSHYAREGGFCNRHGGDLSKSISKTDMTTAAQSASANSNKHSSQKMASNKASLCDESCKESSKWCNIISRMNETGGYDSDEEEELGDLIYRSSAMARSVMDAGKGRYKRSLCPAMENN